VLFQIVARHHDRKWTKNVNAAAGPARAASSGALARYRARGDGSETASHEQVFAVDEPGAERRRQPGASRLFDHPAGAQSASMICREKVWFATRRGGGLHLQRHTSSLSAISLALNL
jgi:hypothetical protein